MDALLAARHYRLEEARTALQRASSAAPPESPARQLVGQIAAEVYYDLGRPELALEEIEGNASADLLRARLYIDAGREDDALRLLGQLMEQGGAQTAALRLLVDFHLRRGAADRARMRAGALQASSDQAFAAARLAADELRWNDARDLIEPALRADPSDLDSVLLWALATAQTGLAEQAIERIDQRAYRALLVGVLDRARLEVLLVSGRAPRESLAEFVSLLQATAPTSMRTLNVLAQAYEAIGDLERARTAAQTVIDHEPNNRAMHALLGRLYHQQGLTEDSGRHLRAYLALAPATEPTDWARAMLDETAPAPQ
jgi:tetratricopeptide (TPR) repeat protein